ncbi:MAG: hypothetical protein WCJ30_25530 [Deltaproteobacteria bacterium]
MTRPPTHVTTLLASLLALALCLGGCGARTVMGDGPQPDATDDRADGSGGLCPSRRVSHGESCSVRGTSCPGATTGCGSGAWVNCECDGTRFVCPVADCFDAGDSCFGPVQPGSACFGNPRPCYTQFVCPGGETQSHACTCFGGVWQCEGPVTCPVDGGACPSVAEPGASCGDPGLVCEGPTAACPGYPPQRLPCTCEGRTWTCPIFDCPPPPPARPERCFRGWRPRSAS